MPSLISHLDDPDQRALLGGLNYLNLAEMRGFCDRHGIPYRILIEDESGERKRTQDSDRKSVVLERVRRYLNTGRVPAPSLVPARIARLDGPPKRLRAEDRLYYGWYDKTNPAMLGLLERLTGGTFRSGAIARILCREFWTAGQAPTFAEFAEAWIEAAAKGLGVAEGRHPEAAWLTDRARGTAGKDWKAKRERIATRVLRTLATIPPP
jgi:hypothetical protein